MLFYLWGIETKEDGKIIKKYYIDAILPMRNWNSEQYYEEYLAQHGCYSTYEELKLKSLLP